jgi:hypothetical protein
MLRGGGWRRQFSRVKTDQFNLDFGELGFERFSLFHESGHLLEIG